MRAKRIGLQRNACVALGNLGDKSAIPSLRRALESGDPLVKCHAAWALGEIGGAEALAGLVQAAERETDEEVQGEIWGALATATAENGLQRRQSH